MSYRSKEEAMNPEWIRKYAPGFIGGKEVAEKATDEEIIALARLQDAIARTHNLLRGLEETFEGLTELIKRRP